MGVFAPLFDPSPELIWGLISRGIGLVFLVSFLSLRGQVLPLAGSTGITPIRDALRAIRRDFPAPQRFLFFPTLLWLNSSDAALRALPWLGIAAASGAIVGGPFAAWALLVCFLVYLSLDRPATLIYPWDCLLFEAGFWGMFLPATRVLPALEAVSAPLPAVAWVYRLLLFRVMLGFGKHKFFGTKREDSGFLKGFLVNQPLPTALGLLSHKLPIGVLKLGLIGMFLVEIPLPFAVFFPGPWCTVAALAIIALMIAIWATGNYGYFNLAVIVLAVSWLDHRTARALSLSTFFSPGAPLFVHALVALHMLLAAIAFPFNTFCAHVWMNWPHWLRIRPGFLTWPVVLARALQPLRWVHAYGVFPPHSLPPAKFSPVTEVTWDQKRWETLVHPYWPTLETSRPKLCAPHHERFDQAVVYDGLGLNESCVFRNFVGRWDPYGYGGTPAAQIMVRKILQGTLPGRRFYDRSIEAGRGPPLAARVRTYMLEPTSWDELRSSKRWWKRTLVGPHFPPMTAPNGFVPDPLPTPELWHFDDLVWLRRSRFGKLMQRAAAGEDPHALVRLGAEELTLDEVGAFWSEFVAFAAQHDRRDWKGLRALVERARERFGMQRLHAFERIAGRYTALLFARLEPLFLERGLWPVLGRVKPTLDVKTHYHLRLLAHHIVVEGKATYDAVAREPARAVAHAAELSMPSGHFLLALFRYESMVYQAQKLRLIDVSTEHAGRPPLTEAQQRSKQRMMELGKRLVGSLETAEFLKTQFKSAEDVLDIPENYPRFAFDEHDEVKRIVELEPRAGERLA